MGLRLELLEREVAGLTVLKASSVGPQCTSCRAMTYAGALEFGNGTLEKPMVRFGTTYEETSMRIDDCT